MATTYSCDRCGRESDRPFYGMLKMPLASARSPEITYDLCIPCAEAVQEYVLRGKP